MKKLLVINHFPTVYPPISGGTLRYFHLYNELSSYYEITLLSQTFKRRSGLFHLGHNFREYKIEIDSSYVYKDQITSPNLMEIYEHTLIQNIKSSNFPTVYSKYFNQLYKEHDIIIHESPYLLNYDCYLGHDTKPRIYNSHNFEYELANQMWQNKSARKFLPLVYELEEKLTKHANIIFVTSKAEKNNFISTFNLNPEKIHLAPNGIYQEEWISREKQQYLKPTALFIGSDYPPNVEAAKYIVQDLANKCPNVEFIVAGNCCKYFLNTKKKNVKLLKQITHKQKLKLFATIDIALNPMFTGSGMSLKTLEFLSAGIPLISTNCGVRGLDLINRKHYVHAEKEDFAKKINDLTSNQKFANQISLCGQQYINSHFSWREIAESMYKIIEDKLAL